LRHISGTKLAVVPLLLLLPSVVDEMSSASWPSTELEVPSVPSSVDWATVVAGALVVILLMGLACGLVGCGLVIRRGADFLVGDVTSIPWQSKMQIARVIRTHTRAGNWVCNLI